MADILIGMLVGSARKGSFSQAVADAVAAQFPKNFTVRMVPLSGLALYNQDLDGGEETPQAWKDFRQTVSELSGFLFVTPEYNRSIPPLLKNALDIASRPQGENRWSGKPGGIISVSPGGIGGFGANHHLRQVLAFLNVYTMQQPEAYIGRITDSLDEKGQLTGASTLGFLQKVVDAYVEWVLRFVG